MCATYVGTQEIIFSPFVSAKVLKSINTRFFPSGNLGKTLETRTSSLSSCFVTCLSLFIWKSSLEQLRNWIDNRIYMIQKISLWGNKKRPLGAVREKENQSIGKLTKQSRDAQRAGIGH